MLPQGLTTAAAQQQRSTGLLRFAKAEQRLARWSGRGRAERLGVKLIDLISLHVYHLDPGNYHAECLTPISRQMPRGWKQMGEEQQDRGRDELGQPGENPRGSAPVKARMAHREATGERLKALPHGSAVQHRQENCILGDSFSMAGQTLAMSNFRHHMSSVILWATPHVTPLVSKLLLSFAAPVLCSYLSWGHSTAAPSVSSARGL